MTVSKQLSTPGLKSTLQAVLFVAAEPLSTERIAGVLTEWSTTAVAEALSELQREFEASERPYRLQEGPDGWRLQLTAGHRARLHAKLRADGGVALERGLLDVLSVVAYRQPIARSELEDELGIEVARALRSLERRQLIFAAKAEPGGNAAYSTTARFLEVFGLESLADLPAFADGSQTAIETAFP